MKLKELNADNFTFIPTKEPKLIDQIKTVMKVYHFSKRTEEAYIKWIKEYIVFNKKIYPVNLGTNDISRYINYLATTRNVSASTQNLALCSIIFLYKHVLKKDINIIELIRARYAPRDRIYIIK